MFIGQQYLQNVLKYSTLESGLAILPGALGMILAAPRSAKLVDARGSRFTLLTGFAFCLAGFLVMLALWDESTGYWAIGLGYILIGCGVGFAGTPASRSLTGSVPVERAGMASGTADLQRDLGGAIMQSLLGALLTAGYANTFKAAIASSPQADKVSEATESQLTKSFAGAETIATQYPKYADQIIAAARDSFLRGDRWAYTAGIIAITCGALLVLRFFPKHEDELELLRSY
jgi:DHA2 family multidrug resistance protein-like MFS transporter